MRLLGEIQEDSTVTQAVRKFLPVIEAAPTSDAAKGLLAVSAAVEQLVMEHDRTRVEEATQPVEMHRGRHALGGEVTQPLRTSTPRNAGAASPSQTSRGTGGTDAVPSIG